MPIITLKKFSYNASLSEETPAYTAVINVDGIDAIHASNYGTGGCDDYRPLAYNPEGNNRFNAAMAKLEAHVATLPPLKSEYFPNGLAYTTEILIGELVDAKINKKHDKALKAKMLKKSSDHVFLVAKDGPVSTLKYLKPIAELLVKFPNLFDKARAKYPDCDVIHGDFETVIWPAIKDKL